MKFNLFSKNRILFCSFVVITTNLFSQDLKTNTPSQDFKVETQTKTINESSLRVLVMKKNDLDEKDSENSREDKYFSELKQSLIDVKDLTILDRGIQEKTLEEIRLGLSGMVERETVPRVGKLIGAEKIILMSLVDSNITLEVANVETAKLEFIQTRSIMERYDMFEALTKHLESQSLLKILSRIKPNDNSVDVKLSSNKTTYKSGEKIQFSVESNTDGYLYLLIVQADQSVLLLVPNDLEPTQKISAGRTYEFPSKDAEYSFLVGSPYGPEIIKAIVTKEPIANLPMAAVSGSPFKKWEGGRDGMVRGITILKNQFQPKSWGTKQISINTED